MLARPAPSRRLQQKRGAAGGLRAGVRLSGWQGSRSCLGVGQRQAVVEVAHPHDVLVLEQAAREAPLAGAPRRARHLRARRARAHVSAMPSGLCPRDSAERSGRLHQGQRAAFQPIRVIP